MKYFCKEQAPQGRKSNPCALYYMYHTLYNPSKTNKKVEQQELSAKFKSEAKVLLAQEWIIYEAICWTPGG